MRVYVISRRDFLKLGACSVFTVSASGCGSILYPERIGQPHSGPLDWKVVALDTIGLLFFFIPGVIAFVVDFANGTIYLPPSYPAPVYSTGALQNKSRQEFISVNVPRDELNQARIEQVVSKHVAKDVLLEDGAYETRKLSNLEEFWRTREMMAAAVLE